MASPAAECKTPHSHQTAVVTLQPGKAPWEKRYKSPTHALLILGNKILQQTVASIKANPSLFADSQASKVPGQVQNISSLYSKAIEALGGELSVPMFDTTRIETFALSSKSSLAQMNDIFKQILSFFNFTKIGPIIEEAKTATRNDNIAANTYDQLQSVTRLHEKMPTWTMLLEAHYSKCSFLEEDTLQLKKEIEEETARLQSELMLGAQFSLAEKDGDPELHQQRIAYGLKNFLLSAQVVMAFEEQRQEHAKHLQAHGTIILHWNSLLASNYACKQLHTILKDLLLLLKEAQKLSIALADLNKQTEELLHTLESSESSNVEQLNMAYILARTKFVGLLEGPVVAFRKFAATEPLKVDDVPKFGGSRMEEVENATRDHTLSITIKANGERLVNELNQQLKNAQKNVKNFWNDASLKNLSVHVSLLKIEMLFSLIYQLNGFDKEFGGISSKLKSIRREVTDREEHGRQYKENKQKFEEQEKKLAGFQFEQILQQFIPNLTSQNLHKTFEKSALDQDEGGFSALDTRTVNVIDKMNEQANLLTDRMRTKYQEIQKKKAEAQEELSLMDAALKNIQYIGADFRNAYPYKTMHRLANGLTSALTGWWPVSKAVEGPAAGAGAGAGAVTTATRPAIMPPATAAGTAETSAV